MAQTGFTPIQLYRSVTAATAPLAADLAAGELALNTTDAKLYFKNTGGTATILANAAIAGIIPGTGVATALAVNVGSAGSMTVNGGVGSFTTLNAGATTVTGMVTSSMSYANGFIAKNNVAGNGQQVSMQAEGDGTGTNNIVITADKIGSGTYPPLWFNVGGNYRLKIDPTGAITFTGTLQAATTVSVGNATPSASGAGITFPATVSNSTSANTLDDYDEYTAASAACTGAITTAVVWKLTKVGNLVTLTLPATIGTAAAQPISTFSFGTAIPAKYRPATDARYVIPIDDNNVPQATPGVMKVVASTGVITVYRSADPSVDFTGGTSAGLICATSISWVI